MAPLGGSLAQPWNYQMPMYSIIHEYRYTGNNITILFNHTVLARLQALSGLFMIS